MIQQKNILFLIVAVFIGCDGPASSVQKATKQWYKGNLHTHSYWSDGDEFPEMIMNWYKAREYHFVALSDHNILAQGDKWVEIKHDVIYQNAFSNYRKEYGDEWVHYLEDSGQVSVKLKTLSEYRNLFEESGKFLIIQSEEISDEFDSKPIHLNATNIQTLIEPQGGGSVAEVMQRNIDAVLRQRAETGLPMFPHINHPNFHYAVGIQDMLAIKGERFFEVYNGHPQVHNSGDSAHMTTEEMWDLINISYIENGKPLMYGLATDDSHHYHVKGSEWSNAGRGWIMVQADSLTPAALINAMEAGEFYASSGVSLKTLQVDGNKINVAVESEPSIVYTITFIGCRTGESEPAVLLSERGVQASFEITDDLLFVRCKVISSKLHSNPIEDLIYEMAWTQPIVSMSNRSHE